MEGHGDGKAVPNGLPPPPFKLPVSGCKGLQTPDRGGTHQRSPVQTPDSADVITANMFKLTELTPNECVCRIARKRVYADRSS